MINFNPDLLQIFPRLKRFSNFEKWHKRFEDDLTAEERFKKLGGKLKKEGE